MCVSAPCASAGKLCCYCSFEGFYYATVYTLDFKKFQKKKNRPRLILICISTSCNTIGTLLSQQKVAPPCWNHISIRPTSIIFGQRKSVFIVLKNNPLALTAFSKKYGPIPTQTQKPRE